MESALKATVMIEIGDSAGRVIGSGTGFIVRPEGVIATNYHVVKTAHAIRIRLSSGDTYDDVFKVADDPRRDIAIIRIRAMNLPYLELGDSDQISVGQPVWAVGNPRGLQNSVSSGIVSAWRDALSIPGAGEGFRLVQTTAPISPGSSGGPLLDANGRVIGITTASLASGQNLNFAVPANYVKVLIPDGRGSEQPFARASFPSDRRQPTEAELPIAAAEAAKLGEELLQSARTVVIIDQTGLGITDLVAADLRDWGKYAVTLTVDSADLILVFRISGDDRREVLEVYDARTKVFLLNQSTGLSVWRGLRGWGRKEARRLVSQLRTLVDGRRPPK